MFEVRRLSARWAHAVGACSCVMAVTACFSDSSGSSSDSGGSPDGSAASDGFAGADSAVTDSSLPDVAVVDGGIHTDAGDASTTLSGCVDKVGSSNTTATFVNHADGICDTYGSFTLTAATAGAAAATNVTLFRTDGTGLNLAAGGGHFNHGVWSTQAGAQNIPGNYVAHLFIATTPNPGPSDFVAPTGPLSLPVAAGDNQFYFFANADDTLGGAYGFGLNVWLGNAPAGSPILSAFAAVPGGTFMADATTGCSPAYDGTCGVSAHTLATTTAPTVTLTSFSIAGVGGATAPMDAGAD
jgi:hypothetical protein